MKLFKNNENPINEQKIVDQIRMLAIDMIDEAKSGHPGIALDAAPILYTLYAKHINVLPSYQDFYNRDRFVLSAGHASALLYATLFFAGYDIEIEDLKSFRQIDSICPGHPEITTPGVDATTGGLGEGLATAVGIAMGEAHARSIVNTKESEIIDYYTYVLASDGDLMEGVASEAISIAGNLKLNKLIVLYDSNDITLDGNKTLSFKENVREVFEAKGWDYILVGDGKDIESISRAIEDAKQSDKPTLIEVKTIIGEYSKNQGTNLVHGGPLDKEDIISIKEKLNVRDIPFAVSNDTMEDFQYLLNERIKNLEQDFVKKYELLDNEHKKILDSLMSYDKKISDSGLDFIIEEDEPLRDTSGKILNAFYENSKILFGGSADLFSSCKNYINDMGAFTSDNYQSPNIYFGVREHAMGTILNGLSLVGFRPYGSTFLAFSDYMMPAIRMSAIMNLPVIYIFTNDSIAIGEDGVTHQAVEQLANLRNIPNLDVYRPADANEVLGVYKTIMSKNEGPSVIILSKTKLNPIPNTSINDVAKGGYIAKKEQLAFDGILISSGEELHTVIEVADRLFTKGIDLRVVSMPNLNLFLSQSDEYKDSILPVEKRKIVVELSNSPHWNKIVFNDKYLLLQRQFGVSGKREDVLKKYGFDIDSLEKKIEDLLN